MGMFDKLKQHLGFDDDYDDDYDEEEYDELPQREYSKREYSTQRLPQQQRNAQPSQRRTAQNESPMAQVVNIHTNIKTEVVILKPEKYDDAMEICINVRNRKPVVVNLENVEFPIAQRIVDFMSGAGYALNGNLQKVANHIFIITPENIDISGDFKEELKTQGVFRSYAERAY